MTTKNRRITSAAVLAGFTLFIAGCGGGGATSGSRVAAQTPGNSQIIAAPIPEATPTPTAPATTPTQERTEVTVICPMPVIEK